MRVLVADPIICKTPQYYDTANIGLLYLVAYAREKLDGVEFEYLPASGNVDKYLKEIELFKPDLMGLSFMSSAVLNAYATIGYLKERFPDLPLICGGTHPTAAPDEVLNGTAADMCCLGEGEVVFTDVIRFIKGELSRDQISNLAWKENGEIKRTAPGSPVKDLDSLPYPAWDMVNPGDFPGPTYMINKPATSLFSNRGCPFNCTFCSNPVWKLSKPYYRSRSPENVAGEVKLLYDKGYREIYLRSDEFNADLDWALATCREIKALGLKDVKFQCIIRADKMTDEFARALSDIGCWLVYVGIESANDRVLKGIKKHITVSQVESTINTLKRHRIKALGLMMMFQAWEEDGKLVCETEEEVRNTLAFAWKMAKNRLLDYMTWQVATPLIGSELYEIAIRHKLATRDKMYTGYWDINMDIPGVNKKTIKRLRLKGMLIQAYMALRSGRIQWRQRKRIMDKFGFIFRSI